MLAYFPTPYPDELLFSVISRLADTMQYTNNSDLSRAIYGQYRVKIGIGLPSHLNSILANLPPGHRLTLDGIIRNHTLYPLYQPFLPTERAEQLKETMKHNSTHDIYNVLGLFNLPMLLPQFLKLCPKCVTVDREQYGQGYWHRIHHVPGVKVCPKHDTILQNSQVAIYHRPPQQRYISAEQALDLVKPVSCHFSPSTYQILRQIADDADWLLNHNNQHISVTSFRRRFHLLLVEQGLTTRSGKVHGSAFITAFQNCYSPELLQLLGCPLNRDDQIAWPRQIIKTQWLKHPLQYLLVIRFFGYSVEEFFALPVEALSFEDGPWPCLNPVCKHYHQLVIKECQVEPRSSDGRPYATFACQCGFTYGRVGPDYDLADRFRIDKIVTYGPVLETEFQKLRSNPSINQKEMAHRLNISRKTLQRWSKVYYSQDPEQANASLRRKPMFNMVDRERHLHNEDVHLAEAIRLAALSLLQQPERPFRLTRAVICRYIKQHAFVARLDLLPLTNQTLQIVVEAKESFLIRCLEWAADIYAAQGVSPLKTDLLRLSGMGYYVYPFDGKAFEQEILARVMTHAPGAVSLRHHLLPSARQDWLALDVRLAKLVEETALQFRRQPGYPTRITGVTIGAALDELETILGHLEMLPQTAEALTTMTETVEAFAARAVAWVMAHDPAVEKCRQLAHLIKLTGLEVYATQPTVVRVIETAFVNLQQQRRQFHLEQKPASSTVDWATRDQILSLAVSKAAYQLKKQSEPLVKITKKAISQIVDETEQLEIYTQELFSRHPDKLPETTRILEEVVESREQFAVRRLYQIAERFRKKGVRPTRSELCRQIGAKPIAATPLIEKAISRILASFADLPSTHELAQQQKWEKRDAELSASIEATVKQLKTQSNPLVRVTRKSIGRHLGRYTLRKENLKHLPKTAALLEQVWETHEAFAIRRIQWCATDYHNKQVRPSRYDFTLAAGVASMVKKEPEIDALVSEVLQTLSHFPPEWQVRRQQG